MENQFSWDNQLHASSGNLNNSMTFSNENQSNHLDSSTFTWNQDNHPSWSVSESYLPKRIKLEDRFHGIHEKTNDNFQPFYLTSCFQSTTDPTKDSCGFSYLPHSYLPCNGQQPPVTSETLEDVKPKPPVDRFYEQNVYQPQFNCYNNQEGTGFLEGMFNNSNASQDVSYDTSGQYGFDTASGHFLTPVSFLPQSNQSETMSMDPQSLPVSQNLKLNQQHPHQGYNHQSTQHIEPQPQQHRSMEETASISSNSSVTGNGAITTSAYFWQYNAQCKGPKAVRLINGGANSPLSTSTSPLSSCYDGNSSLGINGVGNCSIAAHSLPQYPLVVFEDPVQKRNDLVHCSKLRRGDGNDVTPNILRLRSMGDELDRLAAQITRQGEIIMAGGSSAGSVNSGGTDLSGLLQSNSGYDMDTVAPPSWRVEEAKREKNKLASKICRLKKKAFHESNKIKYTGLGLEYKELASLITSLKKMFAQRVSPSLARLLQQPQQDKTSSNGSSGEAEKSTCMDVEQNDTLYTRAKWLISTTHVTCVAGRMDAFVEEVLNLAKVNHAKHPLIKRLSSGCNNTPAISGTPRELPASQNAPKFSPVETPMNHVTQETTEHAFAYSTPGMYDYNQRPGFPSALDLSSMLRSGVEYHQSNYDGSRSSEWGEYNTSGAYNGPSMTEDPAYEATTYLNAYHQQIGPVTYAPQFYDTTNPQTMNGYQTLQQIPGKMTGQEVSNLPASTDVSNADSGIGVLCPQRLSLIT
nr:conserved hypothetical protein [Hymenolepis microstoma]